MVSPAAIGAPVSAGRGEHQWYQRKGFIIPTGVVAALIVIGAIGSAVSPASKKDATPRSIVNGTTTTAAQVTSSPPSSSAITSTVPTTIAPPTTVEPPSTSVAPPVVVAPPVTKPASTSPRPVVVAPPATTAAPPAAPPAAPAAQRYANCAALNAVYPHGVGRTGATDHVSGSTAPVTNFTVDDDVYAANTGRDRDGDGIACEQH
jgi:hypothetical protein